jgi:hypothetical protein
MPDNENCSSADKRMPWNKGKLIGARPPLRPKHVWSIRTRLLLEGRIRDLAMFNLAIDSKLRGCDGPRNRRARRRRQAPLHGRNVVRRRGDFPGEVLAFQNIERQTHALRAPELGTVVEHPPAAAPDPGEDDLEGEK